MSARAERDGFLFATVTDGSAVSLASLAELTASIRDASIRARIVLVQRGETPPPGAVLDRLEVHIVERPLRTGVSAARNAAIRAATSREWLRTASIVAFADDDCSYPAGTLELAEQLVRENNSIVCCPYAPSASSVNWERFPREQLALTPRLAVRVATASGTFFDARVIESVGEFDQRFGVVGAYGGAEDCEYIVRALRKGFAGIYTPEMTVTHPYKQGRRELYFPADLALLGKHALGRQGMLSSLLHQLAYGLGEAVCRKLAWSSYTRGVRFAAVELWRSAWVRRSADA